MNVLSSLSGGKLTLAATGLLASLGGFAVVNQNSASEAISISGTFDCTYVKKNVTAIGAPAQAHILLLDVCRGKNASKGPTDYINGASVQNQEILDLSQGNGPQGGYSTFSKGADSVRVRYQGQVVTTLNANKTPNTTFKGDWTLVTGAGKYAGTSGGSTYSGKAVSKDAVQIDWTGSYSTEGQSAAAAK